MFIKSLNINNLRNLKSVSIELSPGANLLVGDNGAGKTSVLEAMVVLAKGRSFRSGQIGALVGPEEDHFRVVATTQPSEGKDQTLGIERSTTEWRARHNGQDVRQLSDLAEHLPLVLIEPNSHQLVSGPPECRRRFLDWGVFHVEHDFLLRWRRYARALKQRNAALRNQQLAVAESIDEMLADLGEEIHVGRQKQAECICDSLRDVLSDLSPALSDISVRYQKGWKGESLISELKDTTPRDMDRGATGPGPHRAELLIQQNKKIARERLSRGEQKILSAAMLISQARLMTVSGEKPVLLLDDLASEFDDSHLEAVLSAGLSLGCQLWITGTDRKPYRALLEQPHAMFHVEQGIITT